MSIKPQNIINSEIHHLAPPVKKKVAQIAAKCFYFSFFFFFGEVFYVVDRIEWVGRGWGFLFDSRNLVDLLSSTIMLIIKDYLTCNQSTKQKLHPEIWPA